MDEAEHDIKKLSRHHHLDIMRKPNPIIVLLYIQNSHTKMQVKCDSEKSHAINLEKFCHFVVFARFEAVTSSASNNFFWTPPSNNSQYLTEMTPQLSDIEN